MIYFGTWVTQIIWIVQIYVALSPKGDLCIVNLFVSKITFERNQLWNYFNLLRSFTPNFKCFEWSSFAICKQVMSVQTFQMTVRINWRIFYKICRVMFISYHKFLNVHGWKDVSFENVIHKTVRTICKWIKSRCIDW